MPERRILGLTHNPFVEPQKGFFERGGRKTHLEQLRHLSQWSRRVLLVTGPEGVGKTVLYRELAATLEPKVKAARINASLVNAAREVLSAIGQGFGMAVPVNANTQTLKHLILEHVEAQTAGDRLCLTLVDDAHLLDNRAVEDLIALTHESAMHLVLFGEVRMVPQIERAASGHGVGWQEIRLGGYSEADARDYLEWRFQQAKYRGRIPFTAHEVKELVKLSEGLPGRMNRMANVLLVKLESGQTRPARRGFPRLHAALLVLLAAVVGLLYVLVAEEETAPRLEPVVPEAQTLAGEDSAEMTPQDPPAASMTADDAALADVAPSVTGPVADAAVPEGSGIGVGDTQEQTLERQDLEEPLSEAPVTAEPVAEAEVGEEPVLTAQVVEEPVVVAEATGEPVTTAPTPADAVNRPAVVAQPVEEAPPPEAESPAARADEVGRDTAWLLGQNPAYFTLQLVTVSSLDRAREFVNRQRDREEFAIYQLRRDARVLHVVLYGIFSSREAAQRAADRLPPEVGDVQPWIRQVDQVQAAARISSFQ